MTNPVPKPRPAGLRSINLRPAYSLRRLATIFFATGSVAFILLILERSLTVVGAFGGVFTICFLAWLLAFVVSPLVDGAAGRLHIGRGKAVGLVYGCVALAFVGFVLVAASIGMSEATNLVGRIDEATATISASLASLQKQFGISTHDIDLAALFREGESRILPDIKATVGSQSGAIAGTVASIVGTLSIILVLSIFIVSDASGLQAKWRRVIPNRFETQLDLFDRSVGRAFRGFLWSQLVLIAIQIVLTVVVGLVFGLPYLFLMCLIAALCMPIPFVGPGLALLPPVVISAGFVPGAFIPVALLLFLSQALIMNLVVPRLMKTTSGVHPVVTVLSVLVGAQIAGIWGALFGLPVAAVISILANYVINLQAVQEVEGVDLLEVTTAIRAAYPEATPEEVLAEAADQAEAIYATQREERDAS
ncbi:MAG TPA: AI-2E family transporter [Terriglobales bacterium]|nr:AI-2E family transporter [Terriglobales bacterium]